MRACERASTCGGYPMRSASRCLRARSSKSDSSAPRRRASSAARASCARRSAPSCSRCSSRSFATSCEASGSMAQQPLPPERSPCATTAARRVQREAGRAAPGFIACLSVCVCLFARLSVRLERSVRLLVCSFGSVPSSSVVGWLRARLRLRPKLCAQPLRLSLHRRLQAADDARRTLSTRRVPHGKPLGAARRGRQADGPSCAGVGLRSAGGLPPIG